MKHIATTLLITLLFITQEAVAYWSGKRVPYTECHDNSFESFSQIGNTGVLCAFLYYRNGVSFGNGQRKHILKNIPVSTTFQIIYAAASTAPFTTRTYTDSLGNDWSILTFSQTYTKNVMYNCDFTTCTATSNTKGTTISTSGASITIDLEHYANDAAVAALLYWFPTQSSWDADLHFDWLPYPPPAPRPPPPPVGPPPPSVAPSSVISTQSCPSGSYCVTSNDNPTNSWGGAMVAPEIIKIVFKTGPIGYAYIMDHRCCDTSNGAVWSLVETSNKYRPLGDIDVGYIIQFNGKRFTSGVSTDALTPVNGEVDADGHSYVQITSTTPVYTCRKNGPLSSGDTYTGSSIITDLSTKTIVPIPVQKSGASIDNSLYCSLTTANPSITFKYSDNEMCKNQVTGIVHDHCAKIYTAASTEDFYVSRDTATAMTYGSFIRSPPPSSTIPLRITDAPSCGTYPGASYYLTTDGRHCSYDAMILGKFGYQSEMPTTVTSTVKPAENSALPLYSNTMLYPGSGISGTSPPGVSIFRIRLEVRHVKFQTPGSTNYPPHRMFSTLSRRVDFDLPSTCSGKTLNDLLSSTGTQCSITTAYEYLTTPTNNTLKTVINKLLFDSIKEKRHECSALSLVFGGSTEKFKIVCDGVPVFAAGLTTGCARTPAPPGTYPPPPPSPPSGLYPSFASAPGAIRVAHYVPRGDGGYDCEAYSLNILAVPPSSSGVPPSTSPPPPPPSPPPPSPPPPSPSPTSSSPPRPPPPPPPVLPCNVCTINAFRQTTGQYSCSDSRATGWILSETQCICYTTDVCRNRTFTFLIEVTRSCENQCTISPPPPPFPPPPSPPPPSPPLGPPPPPSPPPPRPPPPSPPLPPPPSPPPPKPPPALNYRIFDTFTFDEPPTILDTTSITKFKTCISNAMSGVSVELVQRSKDTTRAYALMGFTAIENRASAFTLLSNKDSAGWKGLSKCVDDNVGLKNLADPPIVCDVASCQSPSINTVFMYIATKDATTRWSVPESTTCAIASIAGTAVPTVSLLSDTDVANKIGDTAVIDKAKSSLSSYGDTKKWYSLDFCTVSGTNAQATAAENFFGAKNNTQAVNLMCNSGSPGVAGVALVYRKQVSVFAGSSSGTCSPYDASALDFAIPAQPSPAKDKTPKFLTELYFIIPVSVGGFFGVVFLIWLMYYCTNSNDDSYQKAPQHHQHHNRQHHHDAQRAPSRRYPNFSYRMV